MKQGISPLRELTAFAPVTSEAAQQRLSMAEARHRELDARLKELGRRAFLTPSEQMEASQIKKHKLRAKDEIDELRRSLP